METICKMLGHKDVKMTQRYARVTQKQLFYWFYPAHVYLLYGASCLLYNVLR